MQETFGRRTKRSQALEKVDELAFLENQAPAVVADAGLEDTTVFGLGLPEHGINYVVAVTVAISAHRAAAVPEQPEYS